MNDKLLRLMEFYETQKSAGNINPKSQAIIESEIKRLDCLYKDTEPGGLTGFKEEAARKLDAIKSYANCVFNFPVKVSLTDSFLRIANAETGTIIGRIDISSGIIEKGQFDLFTGRANEDEYQNEMKKIKNFILKYKPGQLDKSNNTMTLFELPRPGGELSSFIVDYNALRESRYEELLRKSFSQKINNIYVHASITRNLKRAAILLNRNYSLDFKNAAEHAIRNMDAYTSGSNESQPLNTPKIVYGYEVSIETRTETIPARYAIMELDSLKPSNNPFTFSPNPDYSQQCQGRTYHQDRSEQDKVVLNSEHFKASFLLSDSPTAIDGPPIVLTSGAVIGGNGRTMTLFRVREFKGYDALYKEALKQRLQRDIFGIKEMELKSFNYPVLVRVAIIDSSKCTYYSNILNQSLAQEMDAVTEGIAFARQLAESPDAFKRLADVFSSSEADSFSDAMNDRTSESAIIRILEESGVLTSHNRSAILSQDKHLTQEGKTLVQSILLGYVLPDKQLIEAASNYTQKILKALPLFIRIKSLPKEFNIIDNIKEAIRLESIRRDKGYSIDEMLSQTSLLEEAYNVQDKTALVWKILSNAGTTTFKNAMQSYVSSAEEQISGSSMFLEKESSVEVLKRIYSHIKGEKKKDLATGALGDYNVLGEEKDEPIAEFNYEGDYDEQKPLPDLPKVTDVVSKKPPRPLKLKKTKDLFLNMFPSIKIFMKGAPGSGKSSFALMLADDFALNGNVLYILAEETLYRGSLASRIKRMKVISPNIEFLELKLFEDTGMTPRKEILQRLNSGKYQYVIVDSMNVLDDYKIISQQELLQIMSEFSDYSWAVVSQVGKDERKHRGASFWQHFVDTVVKVSKGMATTEKHRDAKSDKSMVVFGTLSNWKFRNQGSGI